MVLKISIQILMAVYVSFKALNKHERQYNMYMNWFIECLSKFVENSFSFPCFPCAWWNEDQRKKEMGNLNFFSYCFEIQYCFET